MIKLGEEEADVKQMTKQTGYSAPRIRQIANGRGNDEQKRNGLAAKCPSLEINYENVSTRSYDDDLRPTEYKSTKKIIYTLDSGFNLLDDGAELITIREEAKTLSRVRKNMAEDQKNIEKTSKNTY